MDEDLGLIEKYLKGDESAAEEIVVKHQRKIYALIWRMTGDVEDSKDLTQKTFMQAFANIKGFKGHSAFYTWLYQIAVNACLSHLSRRRPYQAELEENHPGEDRGSMKAVIEKERGKHLRDCIGELPERQKAAVILRAYEGLTLKETAGVMKCTEGAVKAHYHNGVKRLRELMKERGYGKEA